jgi:diaminopimelate epimerase
MRFNASKLHGAENDFLFVDAGSLPNLHPAPLRQLSRMLCARNTGLGADGLVIARRTLDGVTELLIINSDGSFAATCGNALRCLGLLLLRQGGWDGLSPCVVQRLTLPATETPLEPFAATAEQFATLESGVLLGNRRDGRIGVLMGREKQPAIDASTVDLLQAISTSFPLLANPVRNLFVELANPHWIFYNHGFARLPAEGFSGFGWLAQTQWLALADPNIPLANIGMLWRAEREHTYHLVVFERGAGLTRCCGSGATAARVALESFGEESPEEPHVTFIMPGGEVAIGREKGGGPQRLLLGPASFVAELAIEIDDVPFI